ncbi:MAG TPA: L-glutamate gamma-semialdehyde dehydrogenase [Candidatus Saccharimonadales bacterium]|nr:L-glutamate gamma-semialdehyde dehydrogenase [Candidatus Saccharimonadales bacterium]
MASSASTFDRPEFTNEAFVDFTKAENKKAMQDALAKVASQFGREYPMYIGGQKVITSAKMTSTNPSHPKQVLGTFQTATAEHAHQAVLAANKAFAGWKLVPAEKRAEILFRAAAIFRERKFEVSAWIVNEVGKSWAEADGDTAETIDFCEFYGREMLRLAGDHAVTPIQGEKNYMRYIPLGVGIVIPPWNFPAAIATGMTVASLVTGNTVILKPSEESPLVASVCVDILYEAGIPKEALSLLTGPGEIVGDALVKHPQTRYIAFTGSKEVGLLISENAGKRVPGQIWIKRAVLEMGGKDATIVDEEADIDAAVEGVALAAFGYQGQKCSACSRAIVSEKIYDTFVQKLVARTRKVTVGPAEDPSNYMGPVVTETAMNTIFGYIDLGKKDGKLMIGGERAPGDGYFVQPTVIADVDPKSRLAQEEVFGPVLAVIKAKDFDHALEIANNTEFGLTGAVYSQNPRKIEQAEEAFHVGNLYLNRKCTGALVGAHPFGGFNMSGTDSKTGSKDYLLHFLQGKSIAEKVSN